MTVHAPAGDCGSTQPSLKSCSAADLSKLVVEQQMMLLHQQRSIPSPES
jgi:hypothetical protein